MTANLAIEATNLLDAAAAELRLLLPEKWSVERSGTGSDGVEDAASDGVIELRAPNGIYTKFAVQTKQSFAPRDVEKVLTGVSRVLRTIAGNVPVLVVAPWLSSRSQELLEAQAMNFIDLTGNAFVKLDNPPVYIRSRGAARNPAPAPRAGARARGPKAGRLIRLLADVKPPYGVLDIATATGLAAGYVSRLLDTLDREALIERSRRGRVEDVDVPGLLRSWARSYDVFRSNETATFLAPAGAARALARLAEEDFGRRVAITGSFAARRIAPVAAAALLVAYCDDVSAIVDDLDLMPADSGSNLALLRPFDRVVWDRATEEAGLSYVAPSQAVVDCLTGTGRMPAEGEALLAWMVQNESSWRFGSLAELEGDASAA